MYSDTWKPPPAPASTLHFHISHYSSITALHNIYTRRLVLLTHHPAMWPSGVVTKYKLGHTFSDIRSKVESKRRKCGKARNFYTLTRARTLTRTFNYVKHCLWVFENKILKRLFRPKKMRMIIQIFTVRNFIVYKVHVASMEKVRSSLKNLTSKG